ncbi:MAG: hypothetical protein BWY84_00949 [Candidatus Aerophobetes bacterium ADurb.Bin490]|nr:MAG: hypothetical protein BWY84_00949 [Candidatus Aerophobetes bacterium ADurb.Bin490]
MDYASFHNSRTFNIYAPSYRFIFIFFRFFSAHRAVNGHFKLFRACRPFSQHNAYDFRNNFPCFFNYNRIAFTRVFSFKVLFIVQGRPFNGCARKQNRFKFGNRSKRACAPHLNRDFFQLCLCLFRLKLVGYGPARAFGCHAQYLLLVKFVHFNNHAVYFVIKFVSAFFPFCAGFYYLINIFAKLYIFIYRKARGF